MKELRIASLFDLSKTMMGGYLSLFDYPWEALSGIGEEIVRLGSNLDPDEYERRDGNIWIAKSAKIATSATIQGPCILGKHTEVRPSAFIRGNAAVGDNCVIGNSTELKNVILFDGVQVPHFNYVGDSVLGYRSHMGAGAVTSNVKADKTEVLIRIGERAISTERKKAGAFLGDGAEVGCNAVLNPGTVIGRDTTVYPLSMVRGYVREHTVYKNTGETVEKYA